MRGRCGLKGAHDCCRVFCDDREEGASGGLRGAAAAFPVFNCVEAKSEGVGEAGLSHVETLADALYVDVGGDAHLVTGGLTGEEGFHLVESVHQVIEDWSHFVPLYSLKISSARFARALRSALVRLSFAFFGYAVMRKMG